MWMLIPTTFIAILIVLGGLTIYMVDTYVNSFSD